jgi:D-apionolactonase
LPSASPSDRIPLRTGAFTAVLTGGSLRDIRLSGHRALDAVYAAVRDPDWTTVPGELTEYHVEVSTDTFAVSFTCRHRNDFSWHGRVAGQGGRVTFELDGRATGQFAANRIGFCLLHPIELAGRRVLARTRAGDVLGHFPEQISPHQPFEELTGLRCEVAEGAWLDIRLDGDLFEMEDHRNWTDAGFKTYCTPLTRPYPVVYRRGDRIRQRVRIVAHVRRPVAPVPVPAPAAVRVTETVVGRLPDVGVALSETAPAPPTPSHVYAEIGPKLHGDGLARGAAAASALDAPLDVAVVAPLDAPPAELAAPLAEVADRVGRVSVFDADSQTTPPGAAAALRSALRRLGVDVPVGGGSRANFAELNRARLAVGELDFVTYGVDPRVHHDDPDLIMDTLLAQPHTLRDARLIGGGLPVVVRPVGPAAPDRPGTGDFAGAWLVGSVAALVGAAAVSYVLSDAPPVRRILTALARVAGAPVYAVEAPPREVAALATGGLLLVANLRPAARTVSVDGTPTELGPYAVAVVHR